MSKRPSWWGYVKAIIKEYPALKTAIETPLEPRITPNYDSNGSSGNSISRPTENAVIHNLPEQQQRKYDAVEAALQETKTLNDAEERILAIELVYFKRTHTLEGTAALLGRHYNTIYRWNGDFIRKVAEALDLP